MTQSEEIFQWLEDNRDYFKSEGICKQLGIDKGNFSKYKSTKLIPEKYIVPIIGIITLYGFKSKVLGQWIDKKELPNLPANGKEYFEQQMAKIETEYNFEGQPFLIIDNFTKYPKSSAPKEYYDNIKWQKEKRQSDQLIKEAWVKYKANQK